MRTENEPIVSIDADLCIGSGTCCETAPTVFGLTDDGVATVLDPAGASLETIVDAAATCPTGAIDVDMSRRSKTEFGGEKA